MTTLQTTQKFPKQIKYIIGNEGCERFSYYGMKSILVVFMLHQLSMDAVQAKTVYHLFSSAVYLMPLLGAYLSDRWLGKYKTIILLSLVYCAGHAVLSLWENTTGLYAGLALIALGSGGIKPCVSAHVGDQFNETNQHLVEKVFSAFYWIINFGSFFSTLLIPYLLKTQGPAIAFGIPGILMAIATWVFWLGRKDYVHVPPSRESKDPSFLTIAWTAWQLRQTRQLGQTFWDPALKKFSHEQVEGAQAAARIFKLFATVSVFWALFDQHSSSWILQAERMNRTLFGIQLESSQIAALNPIMVMLLIPIFSKLIYPLTERLGFSVTPLRKMSAGMLLAGFSFVVVAWLEAALNAGQDISIAWQIVPYLIITCAEVMISITGLEFAYTQAPRSMKSTLMSFWLLTTFTGNLLTAVITQINRFQGADYFLFFAALMGGVSLIFIWSAVRYQGRNLMQKNITPTTAGLALES